MTRQQRRAAQRDFRTAVRAVHQEGQGIIKLTTVRVENFILMVADTVAGRADHSALLEVVADVIARTSAARERGQPFLCCACPAELTGTYAVVIATPGDAAPCRGLGRGVCPACGPDLDAIEGAALKGLRGFWPDLRRISVHPEAERVQ